MTFSTSLLAPSIYLYENAIGFTKTISAISLSDTKKWIVKNQDDNKTLSATTAFGYDEYPVNFSFGEDESFLRLGKLTFDFAQEYSEKNLTQIEGFSSCIIRKYSKEPGFLRVESSDVENPSRKITSILFLNNIDQGGELIIKNFDVSVSPKEGSLVVFPASFAYSFKINKPKNQDSLVVISHFV